jgi:hypothetical protein
VKHWTVNSITTQEKKNWEKEQKTKNKRTTMFQMTFFLQGMLLFAQ